MNRSTVDLATVTVPFLKTRAPYTAAQYGDRPELSAREERALLTAAQRRCRWWAAYSITCAWAGVPLGTVMIPCSICGHSVDAWRADVDHVTGRANGSAGNVMLSHATCNRDMKADSAPTPGHAATVARYAHAVTYVRTTTPAFTWLWIGAERADLAGKSVRRQGNGDDYIA